MGEDIKKERGGDVQYSSSPITKSLSCVSERGNQGEKKKIRLKKKKGVAMHSIEKKRRHRWQKSQSLSSCTFPERG